jgi:hypothetical protein
MELLWKNGQVVTQRPNHRHLKKPLPVKNSDDSTRGGGASSAREIRPVENYNQYLFMQENEMASWLHYDDSPFEQTFSTDFLNPPPTVNNNSTIQTPTSVVPSRPPIPPPRRIGHVQPETPNFAYFAKHGVRTEPGPSSILNTAARESTVVDSCDTPAVMPAAFSETVRSLADQTEGDTEVAVVSATFDEPGGSSSSEEAEPVGKVAEQDRKRKGVEAEEWEYQSEVSELTKRCYFFIYCVAFIYSNIHPRRCFNFWILLLCV